MKYSDPPTDGARENERSGNAASHAVVALRALEEHGVDVTGSETAAELSSMQVAADAFRHAAETLAGRAPLSGPADDLCRHVVPPRAADETPRQYVERVNRMTERFRTLSQSPRRDRPR
jgi:hypothetical protein